MRKGRAVDGHGWSVRADWACKLSEGADGGSGLLLPFACLLCFFLFAFISSFSSSSLLLPFLFGFYFSSLYLYFPLFLPNLLQTLKYYPSPASPTCTHNHGETTSKFLTILGRMHEIGE